MLMCREQAIREAAYSHQSLEKKQMYRHGRQLATYSTFLTVSYTFKISINHVLNIIQYHLSEFNTL